MNENKEHNTQLARQMQMNGAGIVIRTAEELKLTAQLFVNGQLVPRWCDTAAKAAYVIEAGAELGFKPVQAINNLQLVNGQLGITARGMAGLIRSSGIAEWIKDHFEGEKGTEEYCCVVKSKRHDDSEPKESSFSVADAKEAGLTGKDNWQHYLQDMLWSRAMARHGRRYYSDVLCGFYTSEELAEIKPPEAQPGPDAGSREQRRKVDTQVTTSMDAIKTEVQAAYTQFIAAAQEDLSVNFELLGLEDSDLEKAWCSLCTAITHEEKNWMDPTAWTMENARDIQGAIKLDGIPQDVLRQIPVPVESEQQQ